MLFTQVLVAAGVVYVGARTLTAHSWNSFTQPFRRRQHAVLVATTGQTSEPVEGEIESLPADGVTVRETERYRLAAAGAFVLTIGGVAFPLLTIASVPFTLYSSIPIFENASRTLVYQRRLQPTTLTSLLIVVWLLTNRYAPAAALAWLHHSLWLWNRDVKTVASQRKSELLARMKELLRQATGAPPQIVWIVERNVEVEIPFDAVKVGDVLAVSAGEFVPVAGEIISGSASLYRSLSRVVGAPAPVRVGDWLEPGAFVVEGKVRIRANRLPSEQSHESDTAPNPTL